MRRTALVALAAPAALLALLAAGCTGSSERRAAPRPSPRPEPLTWTAERVLPGVRPGGITTDPTSGLVYVGGSTPAVRSPAYDGPIYAEVKRRPVLWQRDLGGRWRETHLHVTSFYGAQATLSSVSAAGRVMALGTAIGGAHANPRPSFFTGAAGGLSEHTQAFEVYGGPNALAITAAGAGAREFVMVGQWAPDRHQASGAVWTSPDGESFVRHDAIPGFGDSADGRRTTSPFAVSTLDGAFVIVGSTLSIGGGDLTIDPGLWLSADGTRVRAGTMGRPAGTSGGPTALACQGSATSSQPVGTAGPGAAGCLAAGMVQSAGASRLAAWRVSAHPAATGSLVDVRGCPTPPPAPQLGSAAPGPREATVRVAIGPDGSGWLVASTGSAGVACQVVGQVARRVTVPAGCLPVGVLAPRAGSAVLVCADATGVRTYRRG